MKMKHRIQRSGPEGQRKNIYVMNRPVWDLNL